MRGLSYILSIACLGGVIEANCMKYTDDPIQRQIQLQTSRVTHFTESELQAIYSETSKVKIAKSIPEDQDSLMPHVLSGNPVALFEFAQRDGGRARLTYNGEKQKLLLERGILLLIAVIKGEHYDSRKSLDFIANPDIDYKSLTSLEAIIAKAQELAPKL